MSEKVKQLAEQATRNVESANSYHSTVFDKEKFAELIVQECIDYCGENLSKTVGGALKIHFGIE